MCLRREGVRADLKLAKMWFERGVTYGDKECHDGLGIMWRDGLIDGRKDSRSASPIFLLQLGRTSLMRR